MISLAIVILILSLLPPVDAVGHEIYAHGLTNPMNLLFRDDGLLFVSEVGTGQNDARLSVVTPDGQITPFVVGLPSWYSSTEQIVYGPFGMTWMLHDRSTLLFLVGSGVVPGASSLYTVSSLDFQAGKPPRAPMLVASTVDFIMNRTNFDGTDPYEAVFSPDGAVYFTDAAANAILRYVMGGEFTVLAHFGTRNRQREVLSPDHFHSSSDPLFSAVPTGITLHDGALYVALFTAHSEHPPVLDPSGLGRVVRVGFDGSVETVLDGLTMPVDLAFIPDGQMVLLEFGRFTPNFSPDSSGVGALRRTGRLTIFNDLSSPGLVLADDLDWPTSLTFSPDGDLFISELGTGTILRFQLPRPTEVPYVEEEVDLPGRPAILIKTSLPQNYPNPFNATTIISYTLAEVAHVRLVVYDLAGRKIRTLVQGIQQGGRYTVVWDGRDEENQDVASGVYFYRLEGVNRGVVEMKKILLMR